MTTDPSEYGYGHAQLGCAHDYLLPAVEEVLARIGVPVSRAFDLGCGNGAVAGWLADRGWQVSGVDPSKTGIAQANRAFPGLDLRVGSAYEPLHETFGRFPLVISLEVVEHLYSPREYASCIEALLEPGGYALISTPYHGYLKNLALALSGKMDAHYTALWDHGHIKFWSPSTMTQLLHETSLRVIDIVRLGRIPPLAKSMLVTAKREDYPVGHASS